MWSSGGLVSIGLTVRLNDFRGFFQLKFYAHSTGNARVAMGLAA